GRRGEVSIPNTEENPGSGKLNHFFVSFHQVEKKMPEKYIREESMIRGPKFVVRLRSHTVYENSAIKLFCSVEGYPTPQVKWFKDDVILDVSSGKYFVESNAGFHALSILKCATDDTGMYTAVASNTHGQASSQASIIVKTYRSISNLDYESFLCKGAKRKKCPRLILGCLTSYTKINITFTETFDVTFGKEGDKATLTCRMTINPNLANLQPEAMWYRDEHLLKESRWVKMESGGGVAKLTLTQLAKDDEGLYTLRMVTKGGDAVHRAYVFVDDGPPPVPQAPGAPMDIKIHDANRDYVIVSWKPPNTTTEGPIIGYFVDRCEVGTENWMQCNDSPVKICKYAVQGLFEGHSYYFRVRAVNSRGIGRPSRMSEPIAMELDVRVFHLLYLPVKHTHTQNSLKSSLTLTQLPSSPYDLSLLYCDGESMVLSWKQPLRSGGADVTDYYIDKCNVAKKTWKEVNVPPIKERLHKVAGGLTAGSVYQFRVYGANMIGLGDASTPSTPFKCEAWTTPEPGPAYDVTFTEVRDDSVVVEWKAPVYSGASAITGYFVEKSKKGSDNWSKVNESSVNHCYLKVKGLETGESYVFCVRAENANGIGVASTLSDPVCIKTLPGKTEIKCGVDEESGDIYLSFESCQMAEKSKFVWKKSYQEITDFSKGIAVKTSGSHSTLLFKNPDKEDLGTYSVSVTHTDGASASYKISAEELEKMLALSHDIRNPIIPLKTELAYKILERGRMRFWLQAEGISSAVTYKFFANNKELVNCEQTKMSHDAATGIIEMVMDHFTVESEGTFTVQIQDGRGKAQSSLVLMGNAFKAALAEAEYQRREYIRVKEGPHFMEFLSIQVGDNASVTLVCKVANLKKDSVFQWYKDDVEVISEVPADLNSGVCKFPLTNFSKRDVGLYKATITDDRGQDVSQIDVSGKAFDDIINKLSRLAGSSASELSIQCTAEGIMLQCHMKYYTEEMKIHWKQKDSKIAASERMRIGGNPAMATLEIVEPTDKDKGMYTIEIVDPEKTHSRTLDLSGQHRGKVVGGLPDVVTIMEKKTLSLTCTVCGDPKPLVSWSKNDHEVEPSDQYVIAMDSGKFASLTIKGVSLEDSGKYTMTVQNKYGGESVDIIVSVYKHGDRVPDIKPTPSPKRIMPPTVPIVIPTAKSATPAPAAAKSPAPPQNAKSSAPPRGMKSPTPTRKK
uniref:Myomesin 2 n=1 Tax=Cyprinus carpio TaxID=7962 RepID=A0A8C1ZS24_CYPCA